ncbi:MAG: hypothetical protein QG620_755 [Patescibacteria group bacterium]|nr:hypothetical protein [Patescibacteria group bacterium]
MNIAIFTNNYLPNPYGVSMSIETFRKEFEKRGHAVFIFAPRFPGYVDKNPNVFRYPAWDIKFKIRFPLAIPYSWRIGRKLKKLKIDIIHSQHPNLLGSAAARWAKKKKIPLIFTWHTLYDQYAHFVPFLPPKLAANYIIKKAARYANRADAVVVPTDSIIPILRKWGVTNKNIIPVATGIVEKEFQGADRNIIRKKYNIADNEILLLLVSRLTSEKNVEFVMRACRDAISRVSTEYKGIKFLISGGGDLVPKLKEYVKKHNLQDKIIITGIVERKDLKNYYAAADIFVYGSKSETQGMVVSEAMYTGLPIVAVNATGTRSLVLNKGNGFLVKEDGKEFSEAVEKLINDKELRNKFSETSKRIARTRFTSGVCAEKMLEVYKGYSK